MVWVVVGLAAATAGFVQLVPNIQNFQRDVQLGSGALCGFHAVLVRDVEVYTIDLEAPISKPPSGNGGIHTAGKAEYNLLFVHGYTFLFNKVSFRIPQIKGNCYW